MAPLKAGKEQRASGCQRCYEKNNIQVTVVMDLISTNNRLDVHSTCEAAGARAVLSWECFTLFILFFFLPFKH